MTSGVSGKIALVTGGASGIGAALATELVDKGAEVWLADRQVSAANELAQRLNAGAGERAHAIELDVRDHAAFERVVAEVVGQAGRIDYLFNNAGIAISGEVDTFSIDDWNAVLDVNLRGVVHGIQAVYPVMIRQGFGHIVNTASFAGLVTSAGSVSYAATKHAVVALSRTFQLEAELHGVQVSVLCPGVIRTPILTGGRFGRSMTGVSDEAILKFWGLSRPMAPDAFAERAVRAVLRGDLVIVVPSWWKVFWYLERLSPALSMRAAKLPLKRIRDLAPPSPDAQQPGSGPRPGVNARNN
ncbi:SDR family NAD(P)-dependent oxidoreductase [Mycolicibacterium baixiangningiae]|uniref:SDR family NAD(P)-dependent oxidoreductase n=1 Tax=Mycolicibacterium baixiangningiae TaxID=2761578 RepID=UPI0018D1E5B1|nr:SDR family oxidoreductase [Mycolicibacterium baixiangningiae]